MTAIRSFPPVLPRTLGSLAYRVLAFDTSIESVFRRLCFYFRCVSGTTAYLSLRTKSLNRIAIVIRRVIITDINTHDAYKVIAVVNFRSDGATLLDDCDCNCESNSPSSLKGRDKTLVSNHALTLVRRSIGLAMTLWGTR